MVKEGSMKRIPTLSAFLEKNKNKKYNFFIQIILDRLDQNKRQE